MLREAWLQYYGFREGDVMWDDGGEFVIFDPLEGEMEDGVMTIFTSQNKIYLPCKQKK